MNAVIIWFLLWFQTNESLPVVTVITDNIKVELYSEDFAEKSIDSNFVSFSLNASGIKKVESIKIESVSKILLHCYENEEFIEAMVLDETTAYRPDKPILYYKNEGVFPSSFVLKIRHLKDRESKQKLAGLKEFWEISS